ncbi:MAG: hypothetical protein HFE83_12460 [Lachnospiraceae bacterium]|nr:hypothetical protein [Lachnospiraceae bacterium]
MADYEDRNSSEYREDEPAPEGSKDTSGHAQTQAEGFNATNERQDQQQNPWPQDPYGTQGQWQQDPYGNRQGQWQQDPYGNQQGQWQQDPYGNQQGQWQQDPYGNQQGQWQQDPYGSQQGQWQQDPGAQQPWQYQNWQQNPYSGNPYSQNGGYPPYGNDPYGKPPRRRNGYATASLISGIFSVLVLCCGAFPLSIILGAGAVCLAFISKNGGPFPGTAIAGLILGIIGIVFGILEFVYVLAITSMLEDPETAAAFQEVYRQMERMFEQSR